MSSQNHTTNTNTARTSARKLEKLKPPSKSIAASSFTILRPVACDQFIRSQRRRILHFGSWELSKGAISPALSRGLPSYFETLSDDPRQKSGHLDALRQGMRPPD